MEEVLDEGVVMDIFVFKIFAIFCTPWMIGSPIFIPGGGAVE